MKLKKFIKLLGCFLIFVIGTLLYSRFIATKGLIIKEYKVESSKIITEYHGLKIVHLSDIHYGTTVLEAELENIVNKVNELKPDIVVFTGDLLSEKYDKEIITKYLNKIEAKLGKFAINGNHDLPSDDFNYIIDNSGFTNLNDRYELIYSNSDLPIIISGISSNYIDSTKLNLKTAEFDNYISDNNQKPIYSILLIHEPDFVDNLNLTNYDLILSGHSHGGQVRFPLIGKIYTPHGSRKYYDEYYKLNDSDLYISSGIGTSRAKLRLFNRPSFNFYRITKKN